MTDPGQIWASFTLDPRRPEYAPLRASDQDRNVVHQVLADAYADGRLDRDEFETRTAGVTAAKTLGALAGLVEGLVPRSSVPAVRSGGGLMTDAELQERALAKWHREREQALGGFVFASVVCWVIWLATGADGIPWPLFVMAGTGINVLRVFTQRRDIIAAERRRLEKKREREIEKRRQKGELE
jgi:hypothetical protein